MVAGRHDADARLEPVMPEPSVMESVMPEPSVMDLVLWLSCRTPIIQSGA